MTPNAGVDLPDGIAAALYIGVGGNITFDDAEGNQVASTAVVAGPFPAQVKRVRAATATGILAFYN